MQINVSFDQDVTKLPAGFTAGVQSAVQFLESSYTNPITFNLHVGYGERDGQVLQSTSLGESFYNVHSYTYAQIVSQMTNHAWSADQKEAVSTLPASDPIAGSHTWWVTDVQGKALGLISNATPVDAWVGFADTNHYTFDYNRNDGITAGQYDFFGIAIHEITEVMGRELGVGEPLINNTNTYYPLDLFHYVNAVNAPVEFLALPGFPPPGVYRDFARGGFFAFDNGATKLGDFNALSGGDAADWAPSAGNDAFLDISHPGVINNVTAADLSLMDVLGYDRAPLLHLPIIGVALDPYF